MNQATLIGHLGADIEIRVTQDGFPIGTCRVATTERWKDKEGKKQERTTWHTVKVFGKRAEALKEFLTKGRQVMVQGQIEVDEYEKDGQKRQAVTVAVRDAGLIELLGPKDKADAEKAA